MDGCEGFYRFDFYYDLIIDYQVGYEAGVDLDLFVNYWDGLLACDIQSFLLQFPREGRFVHGLQEAGSRIGCGTL